jgi:excisionase family DNA binding protein
MSNLLTPKQVAKAIQVSESSVKRWCDKGVIATQYTAGGHRRIPLAALVEFLRATQHQLVRPEVVGLPSTTGRTTWVLERAAEQLTDALVAGDEEQSRRITLDLYLAEHSVSCIFDRVYAPAFIEIGRRWECGNAHVYQERRGCEIALRVLHELHTLLPTPPTDAPLAMGGATAGDQYNLATTMVEIVLRDAGWNAVSLGDNLPLETLAAAIQRHRPRLFWLSCSHLEDREQFLRDYAALYDEFGLNVAFVVGGRALNDQVRQAMKYAAYCDNMQHLEAFAQTLRSTLARTSSSA